MAIKGLCHRHDAKIRAFKLSRQPTLVRPPHRPERLFFQRVTYTANGCWEWTGTRLPAGYGTMAYHREGRRTAIGAHRFSYLTLVGPIPDGLELDHLCRNRGCVNPMHLEPVTHAENVRRARDYWHSLEARLAALQ